ncbi:MAG TPA: type I-C CRISPR-associated protein Cas8c/Csd1, partial [Gemmatirosa sp.]
MILRALYNLAEREQLVADPDFPLLPVPWLVTVSRNGTVLGITDTRTEQPGGAKKARRVAKAFPVPYQTGRSGTKAPPNFLVDNAKYVFGRATPDKAFTEQEGGEKSATFRAILADCVRATEDVGAAAVLTALEAIAAGTTPALPDDCASNDLFAFKYEPDGDLLVHQRPAVQAYWRARRSPTPSVTNAEPFACIVTGAPVAAPDLFPKVKYVPNGQPSGTPLVSFNANAFTSYGLTNNENAPISRAAAEACATALQRLLHPAFPDPRAERLGESMPRRNLRL